MSDDQRMPARVRLWNQISNYAEACGGDPSTNIYGNTTRQLAVAGVEEAIREVAAEENGHLRDLIARLVKGLAAWASDEDGVHPEAWDAYADARELLEGKRPCFECGKNPCRDDCNEMVKATP